MLILKTQTIMDAQTQKKLVEAIAKEFECEPGTIVPDAVVWETLGLDSLRVLDLFVLIEEVCGVKVKCLMSLKNATFRSLFEQIV